MAAKTTPGPLKVVTLHRGKVCKASVRYENAALGAPFTNAYISNEALAELGNPEELVFTLAAKE